MSRALADTFASGLMASRQTVRKHAFARAIHAIRARVCGCVYASSCTHARLNYLIDVVQVEVGYARRVTQVLQPPRAANDTHIRVTLFHLSFR